MLLLESRAWILVPRNVCLIPHFIFTRLLTIHLFKEQPYNAAT